MENEMSICSYCEIICCKKITSRLTGCWTKTARLAGFYSVIFEFIINFLCYVQSFACFHMGHFSKLMTGQQLFISTVCCRSSLDRYKKVRSSKQNIFSFCWRTVIFGLSNLLTYCKSTFINIIYFHDKPIKDLFQKSGSLICRSPRWAVIFIKSAALVCHWPSAVNELRLLN